MSAPLKLHVDLRPGLPPQGTAGQFLGIDATGAMWLLRWSHRYEEWQALGYERGLGPDFPKLERGDALQPLIIGHVQEPEFRAEKRHG